MCYESLKTRKYSREILIAIDIDIDIDWDIAVCKTFWTFWALFWILQLNEFPFIADIRVVKQGQ